MSRGAFIPPMVHAWCMHGPFSVHSSAFEFPGSMIHHHAMVPGTHTQAHVPAALQPTHTCRPTASTSRSRHTITPPPLHLFLDAHVPQRTHTCTSTTCNPQPRYTTAAATRLSPVTTTAAWCCLCATTTTTIYASLPRRSHTMAYAHPHWHRH